MSIKVHIKNNHAGPDTFPSTPESESVFTISMDRYAASAARYDSIAQQLDVFVDWDIDHFTESMKTAEVLLTWNLPTENLAKVAPHLKWIHIIGAGVEHLCPMDWVPPG
ncbi:MAG: D-2-hydroxyacid dehydrogenase, partial [Gammaproteobacteria bacterium]|nr:D-2-hydroxyacid dehydrogenase [Gammaproteobacteria bacterium]